MNHLAISVHESPPIALIQVRGEIDLSTRDEFRTVAARLVEVGYGDVTVDLRAVSFIDCAGLQALISLREHIHASGGSLRLRGISPAVSRLLTLTNSHDW